MVRSFRGGCPALVSTTASWRRSRWERGAAAGGSEEERLDAVRPDPPLGRRPREDGEPAVLRRDEGERVALVVHELRRRRVPHPPERRQGADGRGVAH